jgi:PAS domain S-box-containing protein
MIEDESSEDGIIRLRRHAEERSRENAGRSLPATSDPNERLIHDMQVHQIELEMQNEELRITQNQLGETLEKYADLYDLAPVGYVTSTQDGLILEANLTFANQLGIERGRLINTPLWYYAAAADRGTLRAHHDQVLQADERQSCELRLERASGPEMHVQINSIPVLAGDGTRRCWTAVTDISARKEIEKDLARAHAELERRVQERTAELWVNKTRFQKLSQEFHALLSAITDTLILVSPDLKILWTNRGNGPELHESVSDATGQYCYKLLYDRSVSSWNCPITRCFKSGKKETAIVTHNGSVIELKAFPVKEAEKITRVLVLASDITEKMAMQAETMQAGHMASLGELAAGVAHEINNPITGIMNYGQILINECSPESIERDLGKRIVKEGERVSRIVRTLLSYARDGREEKRPIHLPAVLAESITLTQAQIRKEGIDLKIDFPDDLPECDANFQQIQQCFINIINNARYALNEKYPGRHENKRLEISGEKVTRSDRPYLRINFHDRGVGISVHDFPLLTKPFFSTKPFGKGTGLGLSITRKIITDHGGYLGFESSKGDFTRVVIDLPAHRSGARGRE